MEMMMMMMMMIDCNLR